MPYPYSILRHMNHIWNMPDIKAAYTQPFPVTDPAERLNRLTALPDDDLCFMLNIKGLPTSITESELQNVFEDYGQIVRIFVCKDLNPWSLTYNQNTGEAYVTILGYNDSVNAYYSENNTTRFGSEPITIVWMNGLGVTPHRPPPRKFHGKN